MKAHTGLAVGLKVCVRCHYRWWYIHSSHQVARQCHKWVMSDLPYIAFIPLHVCMFLTCCRSNGAVNRFFE